MHIHGIAFCFLLAGVMPYAASADTNETGQTGLHIELNTIDDTGIACRLTFVAQNATGRDIEQAVFETVIFDNSGSVMSLSLFDFRDLPADRPRVRQFDVQNIACSSLGQALINGANTCTVDGTESDVCNSSLFLDSRIAVELLG